MITGENTRQEDVPEGAWFLPFLSEAGQTDLRRICGTNMKQEFYYQQMNKAQKNAYRAMLDGFESLSPEFPVLRLDGKELSDIFFRLRLDHPAIFYVEGFHYRFAQNSEYVQMIPEYMFEKKKIKEMKTALESRISRLVRQAEGMAPEEKEKYVHDFICSNVTYDKLKKQYSHEIIGPLQQGIGVCEGIAKTVKILCDRMGLECLIAISESAPDRGIRYRHAWNLVKLKNTWYHLDATFDNSLGRYGQKRFDYFNLDDKMIFKDHQPLVYKVPACTDGGRFYYKENRLSLTKLEDVAGRFKAVLRNKQPYYVFHWRGGYLTRDVLEQIAGIASEAAREKGKYVRMSVNYSQAVMELAVTDFQSGQEICREEANEGELASE